MKNNKLGKSKDIIMIIFRGMIFSTPIIVFIHSVNGYVCIYYIYLTISSIMDFLEIERLLNLITI